MDKKEYLERERRARNVRDLYSRPEDATNYRSGRKFQMIGDVGAAGFGHMAYAIYFNEMKGQPFIQAASNIMNVCEDDDGIDFFVEVLSDLDELIKRRMEGDIPGIDFGKIGVADVVS